MDAPEYMSIVPMIITTDIQYHNSRPFDYASYIFKGLDLGLMAIKGGSSTFNLRHYSLLMQIVLYFGQDLGLWPPKMRISQFSKDGEALPIQLWTTVWDSRFANSSFIHFEKYFVKTLYKLYNHPCNYSLFEEIKRFLQPRDFNGPIDHNWGDWYCLEGATMIRVYGF